MYKNNSYYFLIWIEVYKNETEKEYLFKQPDLFHLRTFQ